MKRTNRVKRMKKIKRTNRMTSIFADLPTVLVLPPELLGGHQVAVDGLQDDLGETLG